MKKNCIISPNTFGSPIEYPALKYVTDRVGAMNQNERDMVTHLIVDYHLMINPIVSLNTTHRYKYKVLKYVRNEYLTKLDNLTYTNRIDDLMYSHLRNYFVAKFRSTERSLNMLKKFDNIEKRLKS